jgi:hypothetical protein
LRKRIEAASGKEYSLNAVGLMILKIHKMKAMPLFASTLDGR